MSIDSLPSANTHVESNDDHPVVSLQDIEVHFEEESGVLNLFSDPDIVQAVDGVSLDIYENDVVALVGESGCGKTTLGKTAIGLQRPTGGSVEYRGRDIWDVKDGNSDSDISYDEIRESLQIIHQDPGSSLNPNRTIQATLSEPLKQRSPEMSTEKHREQIHTMLEYVGMEPAEDYAQRYPHQLSGGEKQRVALVRALFMNPDVILADEAVSALDVSLRVEIMDLMLELQDIFGTSFVFISHNFSNARYLAQKAGGRIGVMYLGELVEIAPADELLQNPQHPYTKALRWAALEIDPETAGQMGAEAPPLESVDIPDPVDPPSGCRFHTRCPEAREACKQQSPAMYQTDADRHEVACFRNVDNHDYWESEPLNE